MNASKPPHPTDETLHAYGLGKLDAALVTAVDSHLGGCADCRRRVAELSGDSFLGRLRVGVGATLEQTEAADANNRGVRAETAAPPLPRELGDQYELVRELGRGGMGVVWLARNRLLDRLEALKILNRDMLARRGTLDRFLREIRVVAQLNHENVVRAYSALQLGDALVFVLEYIDGMDLARLVKQRGPLPVQHACYFAHQAALGLQHAHERGMVHRDIKPGNLILQRQGQRAVVKVLDFGLAKALSEQSVDGGLTHEGQMLGTPDYIAPEQTLDAQKADIRADIYSLGCTLYYLLAGSPPFHGTSLYDILQAHHSTDARPLNLTRPEVPVELATVVARMMAKDPSRRYQTPKEAAQALSPFFRKGAPATREAAPMAPGPAPAVAVAPAAAAPADPPAAPAWQSLIEFRETEAATVPPRGAVPAPGRRPRPTPWPWAAGLLLAVVAAAGLGYRFVGSDRRAAREPAQEEPRPAAATIVATEPPEDSRAGPTPAAAASDAPQPPLDRDMLPPAAPDALLASREPVKPPAAPDALRPAPVKSIVANPAEAANGWRPLFNGVDLQGWTVETGDPSAWQIEHFLLVVRPLNANPANQGWLLSDRSFSDFRLTLEFLLTPGANSGVTIRAVEGEKHLEIQLIDESFAGNANLPPVTRTGALWGLKIDKLPPRLRVDRWYELEIEARGRSVQVTVNGQRVVSADLDRLAAVHPELPALRHSKGRIGFQNWEGTVRFRNVRVLELDASSASSRTLRTPSKKTRARRP